MEPFEVIDAVRPWVEPTELVEWRKNRETRYLLVGRTSSGKTSLRNGLLKRDDPVGLGSVTREPHTVKVGRGVWTDGPGIDGRDAAIDRLGPLFDATDVVVWVVDGLQPLTRTERDVVELLLVPGTPLACVISKADLLDDEVDPVIERVRRGTEELQPYTIQAGDLRTWAPDLAGHPRPVRLEREREAAMDAIRARFRRIERPLGPERLAELTDVRRAVVEWLARWTARTERMTVGERVADFTDGITALRDDVLVQLAAEPALSPHLARLPDLPKITTDTDSVMATIRMSAAGQAAALRELRAIAASWMGDAQILVSEWAESIPTDAAAAKSWARAAHALGLSD